MNGENDVDEFFDVLVVGGGNAGIGAAAHLSRRGLADVAVLEPQPVHTYRPLLSYVGAGRASLKDAERTQRSVTPTGCTWLRDSAVEIDPATRTVRCASGRRYGYRDLVLGPGLVPDEDALPGLADALDSDGVASNYVDRSEQTCRTMSAMRSGGRAVFTVPRAPVSCTGTCYKPLFLSVEHWRRTGVTDVDVTLVVDRPDLLGVPELDRRLTRLLRDHDVRVMMRTAVTALAPADHRITVTGADGQAEDLNYDMLHLVPPFRGPRWVEESGLADPGEHGLVAIDPRTFRHRRHPEIWALGDGATVDTDPSGGALRRQAAILAGNLIAARAGQELSEYDGYTVAPIVVGPRSLIAAEFDRTGAVTSSLPRFLDPLAARRSAYGLDRFLLPIAYWKLFLTGRA